MTPKACLALVLAICSPAFAANVARLTVDANGKSVEIWLTRARSQDGAVTVKVVAKGAWPKPQALTIYQGGGDDDGYGDDDIRGLDMKPFDLPGGQKGVRVDLTYRVLGGKKKDLQTDTTLVGFVDKTHKVFEVTTARSLKRTKVCNEGEATELSIGADNALITSTKRTAEAALGDDDLPIDKKCRASDKATQRSFAWDKDHFIDPDAEEEDDDE
jgi:hypothetical protein